jgi:acyl dehydratase
VHLDPLPSPLRALPRLLLGMRKAADRSTVVPPLAFSGPLPPDPARLARFRATVGDPHDRTPPTWPAACMTPLLVALVSDRRFPLPAIGLVHRAERITVLAPVPPDAPLRLSARLGETRPCPAGLVFDIHAAAEHAGETVWSSVSEIVWRAPDRGPKPPPPPPPVRPSDTTPVDVDLATARAYAAVSQNRDPIHTLPRVARWLGMPGVVVHGLWTMARAAALIAPPPAPYRLEARFRRPVVVPTRVQIARSREGGGTAFVAHAHDGGRPHLTGWLGPLHGP